MTRFRHLWHPPRIMACAVSGVIASCSVACNAASTSEGEVHIDNFAFTPAQITVHTGTKLVWINRDDIPHTVTDADEPRAFKSPPLDTGQQFDFVFSKPGTYHYFCSLHPHMQGAVVVK